MENTIESKLQSLFHLQLLDSRIDEIQSIRGELPMEIKDLEDEISGLETRLEKLNAELSKYNDTIKAQQEKAEKSGRLITKYETQQNEVKNNREYVALNKEIELQKLEVMAAEKKIRECNDSIKDKKSVIEETEKKLEEKKGDIKEKKQELQKIIDETEREEEGVDKLRQKAAKELESRLIKAYDRIRSTVVNGLAVVTIERDACGGCHSRIPPQRQLDIKQRSRIIVCENCGRIVIDNELAKDINDTVLEKVDKKKG